MVQSTWKLLAVLSLGATACSAQTLPANWAELTAPDFVKAIQKADGVCLLPMGSLEGSGPSQPLNTATYVVRIVTAEAVKQEYAVVFPEDLVARVNNESNIPGAVAFSEHLQVEMLDETVHEMARNGCRKIVIVNAQGGNSSLISEFMTADVSRPHDYVVYSVFGGPPRMTPLTPQTEKYPVAMRASSPTADGHGGEDRTSVLMAYYPALAHPERSHDQPASLHGRELKLPAGVQTELSELPTGYSGDSSGATAARGKALVEFQADVVVQAIRAVKSDEVSPRLQKEFFKGETDPLKK